MIKRYPLHQSPLYKMKNKRALASLLHVSPKDIAGLVSDSHYKVYLSGTREIQEPKTELKRVQKKIHFLLSKIETPSFLYSGKKGLSYVDNAKHHQNSDYALTMDIQSFYASCRREYVFKFFYKECYMAEDVAWLITDLVTYQNKIPTGSPSSQLVAYFAYARTFNRIDSLCNRHEKLFSLYVDDMTISGDRIIPKKLMSLVKRELRKVDLKIKPSKTKWYYVNDHKKVTGGIITPENKITVPNKLRKKIFDSLQQIKGSKAINEQQLSSLKSCILSAQQVEPHSFGELRKSIELAKSQADLCS